MKNESKDEYATFEDALKKILSVSHSELQAKLKTKKQVRKPKRSSASRVSTLKD